MNKPVRKAMDDVKLKRTFMFLNSQFFDNRIPGSMTVEFMKNCGNKPTKKEKFKFTDAYFDPKRDSIFIEETLKVFPDYVTICLLHEMAHVDLHFQGYQGYPIDEGHGTRYHAEIARLLKIGAYDGLL